MHKQNSYKNKYKKNKIEKREKEYLRSNERA